MRDGPAMNYLIKSNPIFFKKSNLSSKLCGILSNAAFSPIHPIHNYHPAQASAPVPVPASNPVTPPPPFLSDFRPPHQFQELLIIFFSSISLFFGFCFSSLVFVFCFLFIYHEEIENYENLLKKKYKHL